MKPSYQEIADAEHEDHMARLEAMKEPRRPSLVLFHVLLFAIATLCAVLAWGAVLVLGVMP